MKPKPSTPPTPPKSDRPDLAAFYSKCISLLATMGESGKYVWLNAQNMLLPDKQPDHRHRIKYLKMAVGHLVSRMKTGVGYKEPPVDVITFIDSPFLLNMGDEIYPKVKEEIAEMSSGRYVEAVLTGGIGTGKTTCALVVTAYSLYELSCMKNPQGEFDLAASSEILFVFQSLKKELSKNVDYARFKAMVDNSPYFDQLFRYDHGIESELRFPSRIIVKPLTGDATAAIGQNVFGGVIDEVNFMVVIENSLKGGKDGGTFDQAQAIYSSIARRRESRFMKKGWLPGMLCLVSSKRYPGEFTDIKAAEAKAQKEARGFSSIYIYDKRVWEVKPEGTFGETWFKVFIGDPARKPRIINDSEYAQMGENDRTMVMSVPDEYKHQFESNILDALRDVAGVSTMALHPFIMDPDAIAACFNVVPSVISRTDCDFKQTRLQVYPRRIVNPTFPRFCHIDIGLTRDNCGMAVGHVINFMPIQRGQEVEILPVIRFDLLLNIAPPKGGEIELENARRVLYALRDTGMIVKWVTMDSFQSTDSLQILARKGYTCGYQSMDKDTIAYEVSKQALYDGRVQAPEHMRALTEWTRLERNTQTMKVDHPPHGSKDVADAMAGVIYGLTMRREIWNRFGVPLTQLPASLKKVIELGKGGGKGSLSYMEAQKAQRYESYNA